MFCPNAEQVYPNGFASDLQVGEIGDILCGASRPGHFQGVVQVVNRLFDIVKPDVAVFGQKDYQQLLVIQQMAQDLKLDVEIISGAIVREKDGLAMSTRNQYLSADERKNANKLYEILLAAKAQFLSTKDTSTTEKNAREKVSQHFQLDYFEILDANTLKQITDNTCQIAILSAVLLGPTRLIDNLVFRR